MDTSSNPIATLFTARTTPGGDTVPGFGMPTLNALLEPATTPIIGGSPSWSVVGGGCFGAGCGYTGWIKANYSILNAGTYLLEFGVVNWTDQSYNSGMAFDGATIAGIELGNNNGSVPEPAPLALLSIGLMAARCSSPRRMIGGKRSILIKLQNSKDRLMHLANFDSYQFLGAKEGR